MAAPRGCLLSFLPGASQPRLGAGLPKLAVGEVHPADRAALGRAQRAAEGAHAAFQRPDVPDIAVADLAEQLSKLLDVVHRLARELKAARGFLSRNDPDRIAKERTDLELRRLGASAAEILALRSATEALDARARLVDQVRGDLPTLEARREAAGQELEAFRARVEARTDARELGFELTAYRESALLALEAYDRTRRELEGAS
ncbi:MAG: hypothetical protein R3F59_36020 [Myxococcota bacterium]